MEEIVNLHRPGLHLRLPPSLSTCAVSLAGWLAGYSENIEWKACSIQPVSQSPGERGFGWGEQPGFRLWSPGVMTEPRAEKSGESLPQACFSIYPRFHGKSLSNLISNIFCTVYIYMCVCQHRYIPGLFHKVIVEQIKKKKRSNLSGNPVPTLSFCMTL